MNDDVLWYNPKRIPIGSVAYFLDSSRNQKPWNPEIAFGIVSEHYPGDVCLLRLERPDNRMIDGVPIAEFESPSRYRKLPKGWTYNTKLFEVTYDKSMHTGSFDITDPNSILKAYSDGVLVEANPFYHCYIDTDIDKHDGWRIVLKSGIDRSEIPHYSLVNFREVYGSYEEAAKAKKDLKDEFERQASLSEHEWVLEKFDNMLDLYAYTYGVSDKRKKEIRDRALSMPNFDDLEFRAFNGDLQCRKWNGRKWASLVL